MKREFETRKGKFYDEKEVRLWKKKFCDEKEVLLWEDSSIMKR